ncbi:MAG: NAD-dependent epimerase/dehydratase family protein [Gammaproteobacteria bacterium]|nr:NAD-dependent epimerase/dehydratase family protein [Gammaproteobacteria bacterium]
MNSLVTGATGFIGSAVARALLTAGHRVRVMIRATSDRRNIDGLDVEIVEADLLDPDSLLHAVVGMDYVFHVAADYRLWVPDPEQLYRINVTGTRALLEAARLADVQRVVFTSSVATLGLNADGTPADESTPVSINDMIGHYKRSKFLGEELALEAAAAGLDVVIVNPSAPVGPRDIKPTPTGQMIIDAASGRMPVYVNTGLNIVHVDDVAHGHLLAASAGLSGRRYILGCENMCLADIIGTVAKMAGKRSPRFRIPVAAVMPVAYVAEGIARLTGRAPAVTVDGVRLARKHMYFSSQRAADELGYQPRPALDALRDAVEWFRLNGYLH